MIKNGWTLLDVQGDKFTHWKHIMGAFYSMRCNRWDGGWNMIDGTIAPSPCLAVFFFIMPGQWGKGLGTCEPKNRIRCAFFWFHSGIQKTWLARGFWWHFGGKKPRLALQFLVSNLPLSSFQVTHLDAERQAESVLVMAMKKI